MAALVISVLALVVAASSTATAALMIGSNQIKPNAVKTKHIKKNAVKAKQIKKNAIKPRHLSPAARAGMTGAQGPAGPVGAPGTDGAPGLSEHTVETTSQSVAVSSTQTLEVECDTGMLALGGGHQVQNGAPESVIITRSRPNPESDGWMVTATNTGTSFPSTVQIYAVCAKVG